MKVKRLHWQHQVKDGPNYKVNDTIAATPYINPMSSQIIIRKEATIETSTATTTQADTINQ